ncbi:MAG: hypothetical protein MUF50_03095 [Planctomycetes bacterium]|jgi:sugar-specific transcriptional regulator TrmB|nr:hypothetical protein [Planctomycetota bacterium]
MLKDIFEKFQLQAVHADIYSILLESGPLSAGNIIKRLNMPRSTVYGLLNDLKNKNLLLQSEKNDIKIWQAVSPEKINEVLGEEINNLENTKMDFSEILPLLLSKQNHNFISPKFSYFEGAEGLRNAMKDVLLYRDLVTEAFWPMSDMLDVLGPDFLAGYNIKRIRQNIALKVIWPEDKKVNVSKNQFLGTGKELLRELRIADHKLNCSMGYWIYGNKVLFISSRKESFAFIVESLELTQLLRSQFDFFWKNSKPFKIDREVIKDFLKKL